jgi:hypothetical protein
VGGLGGKRGRCSKDKHGNGQGVALSVGVGGGLAVLASICCVKRGRSDLLLSVSDVSSDVSESWKRGKMRNAGILFLM